MRTALHWLNANTGAITAVAAVAYTIVSVALWRATKRQAELAQKSFQVTEKANNLTREIFEATHKPRVAIDLDLKFDVKTHSGPVTVTLVVIAHNYGLDVAQKLVVSLESALHLFAYTYEFSDLEPAQERPLEYHFDLSGPMARAWLEDIRQAGHIKFAAITTYRDSSSKEHRANQLLLAPAHPDLTQLLVSRS